MHTTTPAERIRSSIHIYVLEDPRTQTVRYIGRDRNPRQALLRSLRPRRLSGDGTPFGRWLHDLSRQGLEPRIRILESVTPGRAVRAQQRWISHYQDWVGDQLTNTAATGSKRNRNKSHAKTRRQVGKTKPSTTVGFNEQDMQEIRRLSTPSEPPEAATRSHSDLPADQQRTRA